MAFLLMAALTQAGITTYLLWQDSYRHRTEKYLWLFVLTLFVHLAIKFVLLVVMDHPVLFQDFATSVSVAYGPLLFFYVQTIRQGKPLSWQYHWLHLTPLVLLTTLYIVVGIYIFNTGDFSWLKFHKNITRYAFFASSLTYTSFLLYTIYREGEQRRQLKWLRLPLWIFGVGALWLCITFTFFDPAASNLPRLLFIGSSIITVVVIFRNILKNKIIYLTEDKNNIKILPASKYQKSGLTEAQMQEYTLALQGIMAKEKPYLDPDLSLTDLATRLNTSNHHLTEVLNIHLEKNFFQFVNEYRIDEARRKIEANPQENLFILANACGFNSKTTFIKYFKQIVGTTPSLYSEDQKSGGKQYNQSA